MSTVTVRVDASDWQGVLPHAWTYIGYDECNYTTTPEGEALLGESQRVRNREESGSACNTRQPTTQQSQLALALEDLRCGAPRGASRGNHFNLRV